MKVLEDVPYIKGLDKWLGTEPDGAACAYLKDFGAAGASNGSIGLYHVDNLTPEAKEQGEALVAEGAKTYVVDDAELRRVVDSYPCIWKDPDAKPRLCFMALGPSALILDEPTSQLDPIAASDFLAALGRINRELGVTVLLSEQRLEETFPMSSRVLILDGGRLLCDSTPARVGEALRAANHAMTTRFISQSPT